MKPEASLAFPNPGTRLDGKSELQADAAAVNAVQGGDRERYRELVDRYAPKVFAVAWSRLGDRDLAEEATQEAFIAGFRRLPLLRQAEKFGAWITTIARHTAINLGLRHRGELRRRQRWAQEHPEASQAPSPGPDPLATDGPSASQTLRASLEALPAIHRECLVLFYLENRSIAEAARALGVRESTFKVRLHRARSALRDAMELQLEAQLEELRPPSRLAQAVMVALPAQPASWLAVGGLGPALGKLLPISGLWLLFQCLIPLPGILLGAWLGRKDLANFRDPDGFRARLYRHQSRRMLLMVFLLMAGTGVAMAAAGPIPFAATFGTLIGVSGLDMIRRSHVVRHPFHRRTTLAVFLLVIPLLGIGVLGWPTASLLLFQAVFFLVMSFGIQLLPPRMDYSLVSRAAHGLLHEPAAPTPRTSPSAPIPAGAGLRFARFLGSRLLVDDWQGSPSALRLRLPRIHPLTPAAVIPFLWFGSTHLTLHSDGRVRVFLGPADAAALAREPECPPREQVESGLSQAIAHAWASFRQGDIAAAAQALGETAPETVFVRPHHQAPALRWRVGILRVAALLMTVGGILTWIDHRQGPELRHARRLQDTGLTETEVRDYLDQLGHRGEGDSARVHALGSWESHLRRGTTLPRRSLFTPATLADLQSRILDPLQVIRPAAERVERALDDPAFLGFAVAGLLNQEELAASGFDAVTLRSALTSLRPAARARLAALEETPFRDLPYRAIDTTLPSLRARFLRGMGVHDVLDFQPAVEVLLRRQIHLGPQPAEAWPLPDPALLQGLFNLRSGSYLIETAEALGFLEAVGALDRIDRQTCLRSILGLHQGRGLFVAPVSEKVGPYGDRIRGEAPHTWAAFECLRILHALDRVPDLARWEFRPAIGTGHRARLPDGTLVPFLEPYQAWWLRDLFRSAIASRDPIE